MSFAIHGPHERIETHNKRERFALQLFDRLWLQYRSRVQYVQVYEKRTGQPPTAREFPVVGAGAQR